MTAFIRKIFLGLLFLLLFTFFPKSVHASTLTITPANGSIPLKGNFTVTVKLNTGADTVNAVSAYIAYPADKLDVSYINSNYSAFKIQAEQSSGGGMIKIGRGNISGVKGSSLTVASITFKGKTLGSATLAFVGGSHSYSASGNNETLNLSASGGGTYTVINSPLQTATDNSGPKITDISVKDISTQSATIYWQTDKKSDSTVLYGIDKTNLFLHSSDPTLTTSHKITINDPLLIPGLHFFYQVKSRLSSGQETASDPQELTLKGYTVVVTVMDSNNKPISGANVSLYSFPQTSTTSASGEATFTDVTPGTHLIKVSWNGGEKSKQIEVQRDNSPQRYDLQLDSNPLSINNFKSPLNTMLIAGILGAFFIIIGTVMTIVNLRH